jgi:hypothetical protein
VKPEKNTTEKENEKEKGIYKNNNNRKDKKMDEMYGNNKKSGQDQKPIENKSASTKEALHRISGELIQQHKSSGTSS